MDNEDIVVLGPELFANAMELLDLEQNVFAAQEEHEKWIEGLQKDFLLDRVGVMTVRPGLLFFFSIPSPFRHTTDSSFTLRTVRLPSYLLHALPSPLLYYIRAHQYLLMCTLCAPFMPAFPHRYLMYHCTLCACLPTP